MDKSLVATHQNVKVILSKSKKLLDITHNILEKKDDEWIEKLWRWADKNNIKEYYYDELFNEWCGIPRKKEQLLKMETLNISQEELIFPTSGGFAIIEKIPEEIGYLKQLKKCDFSSLMAYCNKLPDSITKLINLEELVLGFDPHGDGCEANPCFDSITDNIGNLVKLKKLYLDCSDISYLPISISKLHNLIELSLNNCGLKDLTDGVSKLINLKKLELRNNQLKKLPDSIVHLINLEELTLWGNDGLILSDKQKQWINELKINGCKIYTDEKIVKINGELVRYDLVLETHSPIFSYIVKENIAYSQHILKIDVPNFEKIRRYCNNLVDDNQADDMQKYLAEKGKMHKALIYDALEKIISQLNGKTLTLVDWGCGQGIGSMLVLDYIKEKQLNIEVDKVILIDDDTKALSRAIAQVEALSQDEIKIRAIKSDDNNLSDISEIITNSTTLNILTNDIVINFWALDYNMFKNAYFVCVSNKSNHFVNEVYEGINGFINVQNVSIRDGRIGRFDKYERIFIIDNNVRRT